MAEEAPKTTHAFWSDLHVAQEFDAGLVLHQERIAVELASADLKELCVSGLGRSDLQDSGGCGHSLLCPAHSRFTCGRLAKTFMPRATCELQS